MKVKEFKYILLDMMKSNYDEDRDVDSIAFSPDDGSGPYFPTGTRKDPDGRIIIEYDEMSDDSLDIRELDAQLTKFDKNAEIVFELDDYGDVRKFDLMSNWDTEDDYMVVDVIDIEDDDDSGVDFTNDGERETAVVRQLKEAIIDFGKKSKHLFATDDYVVTDASVDSIYPRDGKVILQSNQIEMESVPGDCRAYSLTLDYILHCLKWFDNSTDILFMHCDDDNNITFFDITGYHFEDGEMYLDINER